MHGYIWIFVLQLPRISSTPSYSLHDNQDKTVLSYAPQLEFEVVGAGGKDTYIAVDDIHILSHPCENRGWYQLPCVCTFFLDDINI